MLWMVEELLGFPNSNRSWVKPTVKGNLLVADIRTTPILLFVQPPI